MCEWAGGHESKLSDHLHLRDNTALCLQLQLKFLLPAACCMHSLCAVTGTATGFVLSLGVTAFLQDRGGNISPGRFCNSAINGDVSVANESRDNPWMVPYGSVYN